MREGFRESRRCSRDTYPESYITKYILTYEDKDLKVLDAEQRGQHADPKPVIVLGGGRFLMSEVPL